MTKRVVSIFTISMKKVLYLSFVSFLAITFSFSLVAQAGTWPEKEVEIIVPWSAGGATDVLFRAVSKYFPKYANGKPLIIKNMPGGGAAVGYGEGARANADGYTLTAAVNPIVTRAQMGPSPYHPVNDYDAVCLLVNNPCMIMVNHAEKKWDNLKDFMDYAKENPNSITLGNGGAGGGNHLVGLRFENHFGVKFIHVPFPGGGPSVTALVGGHVDSITVSSPEGYSNVEAGELDILAVFANERLDEFPQFPTAKEQGYDFQASMWRGVVVPKGTDPEIIERIAEVFKAVLEDPEFRERATQDLGQNLTYMGPEEFQQHIESEFARYKEIITKYGLGDLYK